MKLGLIYTTFRVFTLSMILNISYSQDQEFVNPKSIDYLSYYIGNLDNKDLYVVENDRHNSKILVLEKDKIVNSIDFIGMYNLRLTGINKPMRKSDYDLTYKKWFIYKNNLFSLSEKINEHEVWIQLNKYDHNIKLVDSTIIYNDIIEEYKNFNYSFKHDGDNIGLIGLSQNKSNDFFSLIINLEDYHKTDYRFNIEDKQVFNCSDFIFNNRQELLAVFEGQENLNSKAKTGNKLKPLKLKAILINCTSKEITLDEIKSNYENYFVRSYKLEKIDNENVLIAALTFSNKGGMQMNGYQVTTRTFESSKSQNIQYFETKELNSPKLWSKMDYSKLQKDDFILYYHFQYLKEIISLKNGTYIFISEGNYTSGGTGPGDFNGAMGVSSGANGTTSVTRGPSFENSLSSNSAGDIIVTSINLKENKLMWCTKTKKRIDVNSSKVHTDMKKGSYFLTIDNSKMMFYYPESQKNFDEFGNLNEKYKYPNNLRENTVASFEVFLYSGVSSIKEIKPNLTDRISEILVSDCTHLNSQNEIIFFTYRMKLSSFENYYRLQIRPK